MQDSLLTTLDQLLAFDAPSGHEQKIANFTLKKLQKLGFQTKKDKKGNVIGYLPGNGKRPFLLSAHLDRVPPGRANIPIKKDGIIKSNGKTNLGADNASGIAIILEALQHIIVNKLPHPALIIVFTVEEEIGLRGARAVNLNKYKQLHGIVYDNAGSAGKLITKGASYIAFDVTITSKPSHPGKDLSQSRNAFAIIQEIDWMLGKSDTGKTRINIGTTVIGTARNIIPGNAIMAGEIRSFLTEKQLKQKINRLEKNIKSVCKKYQATYTLTTNVHAKSYIVSEKAPLVQAYKQVLKKRKKTFVSETTFIASDTSVFRAELNYPVVTISTGVEDEHTTKEWIRISDLTTLTQDLIHLLQMFGKQSI